MIVGDMGESRITECAASNLTSDVRKNMLSYKGLMSIIENDFDCAGMCQVSDFYLFTDVNKGIPAHSCKQALSD